MSTYQAPGRPTLQKLLSDYLARIRRLEGVPPPPAVFEIKLFADEIWPDSVSVVETGDKRFVFMIEDGLDQWYLWKAQAYVSTVGSDDITVQVRNLTTNDDMLIDPILIPAGELTSCQAEFLADDDVAQVAACDLISLDVDQDGGGDAKGLGVIVVFRTGPVAAVS